MNKLRPIVIAGPSGSGKDTIIKALITKYPFIHDALGYTTRQKRNGEIDGVDLKFVSKDAFQELIRTNQLFEYSIFDGNYYGMPLEEIENAYSRFTIFNIGIDAAKKLKAYDKDIITILIVPPTKEELLIRIGDRGIERYNSARDDMLLASTFFDNLVINQTDKIEETLLDVEDIIFKDSTKHFISDYTNFINDFFKDGRSRHR